MEINILMELERDFIHISHLPHQQRSVALSQWNAEVEAMFENWNLEISVLFILLNVPVFQQYKNMLVRAQNVVCSFQSLFIIYNIVFYII